MDLSNAGSKLASPKDTHGFFGRLPKSLWLVAVLVALLHIAPFWRAQSQTPPGWTFTGNVNSSPDQMQYRVWMRRSLETGPLVDNTFTTEPNSPYLPVFFYYFLGRLSQWSGWSPEYLYSYIGCLLAFVFATVLFATVRLFTRTNRQTWWVFWIVLLGGGLSAHMKGLSHFDWARENNLSRTILVEGLSNMVPFEDYRFAYVYHTLLDTHFLLLWLMTLSSVVLLYFTLRKYTTPRLVATCLLFSTTTALHLYSGITLFSVALAVACVFSKRGIATRNHSYSFLAIGLSVLTVLGVIFYVQQGSGLPLPGWRADVITLATLLISFPVAWLLIIWGGLELWRSAGFKELFLFGWALGCTVVTLSGPFYPWPDRGLVTLQIPLYLIAAIIYFSRSERVTAAAAVIVVLLLGVSPALAVYRQSVSTQFSPDKAFMFKGPEHQAIVDILRRKATSRDVLLLDKSDPDWLEDDLWLAPEFLGRLYCGHFFLTVDYQRKRQEVSRFFRSSPKEQADFLETKGIRFLYVDAKLSPERFADIPNLVELHNASIGSLYEFRRHQEKNGW